MRILKAGVVTLGYDNGFLRRISYDGHEILRMIYFALRDHNWNNVTHHIENEDIVIDEEQFNISYDCSHVDGGVTVMEWKANISGHNDGTISFEIDGRVLENFRKNRAGFCVLHPLNVVGTQCDIMHDDATVSANAFPVEVAAENPFKNIRSMTWRTGGHSFSISFEGDVFETEDQRNWGDASFKTFCTPLAIPFPVELRKGQRVRQRVVFRPEVKLPAVTPASSVITLRARGKDCVLPFLGIGASTEMKRLPDEAVSLIKALRLRHYRVDLFPSSERFAVDFSSEYENAYALGIPLEVVLHLSDNFAEEMEAFAVISLQNKVRLKKVLLLKDGSLVTSQDIIDQAAPLKDSFPGVAFGGGTNYNFNELNKNRFHAGNLDFVSFAMDPQEHATDDLTILENTGSLEYLVRSASSIYGDRMPIHVSPLALRKRANPYATNPAGRHIDERKKADPRQKEFLGALWTFGAVCNLAEGMAASVTLYQTIGNQGIISADAVPYPLYDTIMMLAPFQGKTLEALESTEPLSIKAVILDGKLLVIANMTPHSQKVTWNSREFMLSPYEIKSEKL